MMTLWAYIFQKHRPEDYKQLPAFERRDYWYAMFRTVRLLSKDVIEVIQYPDQRLRVLALVMSCVLIGVTCVGILKAYGSFQNYRAAIEDDYDYVFNFDELIRKQYHEHIKQGFSESRTEEEYVRDFQNNSVHSNRFWNSMLWAHFIFPMMALILLGIALFLPRACPVRFDRKDRIAYTWHKGKLWVADIGPWLGGLRSHVTSEADGNPLYNIDTSTGAVGIELFCADDYSKIRMFRIGIYPVCYAHQNADLQMFIQAFMSEHLYVQNHLGNWSQPKEWNSDWLCKLERGRFFLLDPLRWLGNQTLGPKRGHCQNNLRVMPS